MDASAADRPPPGLDRRRYLLVVWFVARVAAHMLWWDVLLRRLGARGLAARSAGRRWRSLAERFRALAVRQGGVLIKLGQFLSIRVDVLPAEVTEALAGLQDEVPAEPIAAVLATITADFGRPAGEVYARLEPEPLGAASLAQVHRATLPDGTPVVVKVQRSGISRLVETDLAALRFGKALLQRFGWVRRRADLDTLLAEFARTTRAELDFAAEGRNTERFGRCFAADARVRVPAVHWGHTRGRVLTLEDVSGIKVTDTAGLAAAGVDPVAVARDIVDVYFAQVFVHNFVHADPHPGNLFVRPTGPAAAGYQIAFVDFGMMAEVPERVRAHLRDYLIGLATRDAARMVRAYDGAGLLLPGADRRRVEEAQAALLSRFWGVRMGDLQSSALAEARAMMREFGDLLRDMPFQLPSDLLFVGRAVGMLSGLATRLDPQLDIWAAAAPYARRLMQLERAPDGGPGAEGPLAARLEELRRQLEGVLAAAGMLQGPLRAALTLPGEWERVLGQAAGGQLVLRHDLTPELRQQVEAIVRSAGRLVWAIAFGALALTGAVLRLAEGPSPLANAVLAAGGLALLVLLLRR